MSDNELTTEDVKGLLTESENFKKLKAIHMFGMEIDFQSTIVTIISIVIWFLFWVTLRIFDFIPIWGEIIFFGYIIISLLNLVNSATDVSSAENERSNISNQQNFIQGGMAVFILALVFLYNIPMQNEAQKVRVYIVLLISLILCSASIILINLKNESINIRFVRKIQQGLYNQGLFLFIFALIMIYKYKKSEIK